MKGLFHSLLTSTHSCFSLFHFPFSGGTLCTRTLPKEHPMSEHLFPSGNAETSSSLSSQLFRKLFERTSQPATLIEDGLIIEANQASVELFGRENSEELFGLSAIELSPEYQENGRLSVELAEENIRRTMEEGKSELDWECVRKNGERFFIHLILTAVKIDERVLLYAVYNDISRRKEAESRLQASEYRFRHLFEATRQATLLVENGKFILANKASADLLGVDSPEKLVGLSPLDVSPRVQPDGTSSTDKMVEVTTKAIEEGSNEVEWECVRGDGQHMFIRLLLTRIEIDGSLVIHSVFNDITEEKKARDRIEFLAYYDEKTALPNRIMAYQMLNALILVEKERNGKAAVLLVSLSAFRSVRNLQGRKMSDTLEIHATRLLNECLRSGDTLYHLASAEFLLVLPDAAIPQVENTCRRIRTLFDEPFLIEGVQIISPVSIGIAITPEDGMDSETLVAHADIALTEAKRHSPKGFLFYTRQMSESQTLFVRGRNELTEAVRHEQFVLHYQPKIDIRTGKLSGAEALIRWNHPERALVMPGEFIDVAESSGLIVPMSRWVLKEACTQAEKWRKKGMEGIKVAVNLSAEHFHQNLVEKDVADALQESGLPPSFLELELTESILLEKEHDIFSLLEKWSQLGIQLSIDDFGTGYSSLSYLSRFSIDKLKIDRSFIVALQHGVRGESIVKAIIELGKALDLRLIAEGVETEELIGRLRDMGCDEIQGYYYSKPLPPDEFEQWVSRLG